MYKVYWTDSQNQPCAQEFSELTLALAHAKFVRDLGRRYVTMVSENPDVTGPQGVDSVENGLLPDGSRYTWKKRRR